MPPRPPTPPVPPTPPMLPLTVTFVSVSVPLLTIPPTPPVPPRPPTPRHRPCPRHHPRHPHPRQYRWCPCRRCHRCRLVHPCHPRHRRRPCCRSVSHSRASACPYSRSHRAPRRLPPAAAPVPPVPPAMPVLPGAAAPPTAARHPAAGVAAHRHVRQCQRPTIRDPARSSGAARAPDAARATGDERRWCLRCRSCR